MARIYPSSLINSFTGRLSDSVFEKCRGINYIRSHRRTPLRSKSQKQFSIRGIRSTLSGLWFPLSPSIKSLWKSYSVVSRSASSGYHSFLDINTRLYYLLGQNSYRLSPPPFPSTPTHVSGISGSDLSNGSFNISWLKPSSSSTFIFCNYRPVLSHYKLISTGWKFGFTSDSSVLNKTFNTGYESSRLVDLRLRSFDSYGRVSPWSNTFKVFVPTYPPWLINWSYRKSHVINPATGAGTNYQKQITVHYGAGIDGDDDVYLNGKCKTDFGDIRFTDDDKTTLIDYWMESKTDSDNAVFWVEIADSLESSAQTIYIYYGNAEVSIISNGDATFGFFDDFLGSSIDLDKWIVRHGDFVVANSELISTGGSPSPGLIDGIIPFNISKAIHTKVKWSATTSHNHEFCSLRVSNNNFCKIRFCSNALNQCRFQTMIDSSHYSSTYVTISTPTIYHIYTVTWKTNQAKAYQDSTLLVTKTIYVPTSDMVPFFLEGDLSNQIVYVDWIFIRKYVSPEPQHGSWGIDEQAP